jgi:hypothetical protein
MGLLARLQATRSCEFDFEYPLHRRVDAAAERRKSSVAKVVDRCTASTLDESRAVAPADHVNSAAIARMRSGGLAHVVSWRTTFWVNARSTRQLSTRRDHTKRIPSTMRLRELTRKHPDWAAPTFNPKVVGSKRVCRKHRRARRRDGAGQSAGLTPSNSSPGWT